MLNTLLTSLLIAVVGQTTPEPPSPGALRLIRTAEALESSIPAPLQQRTVASAWIATATAAIGGEPPDGPPDSATASPELMAVWASSCVDAAAAGPLNASGVAYAEVQVETIARLIGDVDKTGTEPPDPRALARVLLLGGDLALANGNTAEAKTFADRSATALDWKENLVIQGTSSLGTLFAQLGDCASIEKLAQNVPPSQIPALIASSASQPTCADTTTRLLKTPSLLKAGRIGLLLHELNLVHGGAATELLLKQDPTIQDNPALRILAVLTLLSDGRIDAGLQLLGGQKILDRLKGIDKPRVFRALSWGYARNGDFDKAMQQLPMVGGFEYRFFTLIEVQSRMIEKGVLKPDKVLASFETLRAIRTTALDPFLPRITARPMPIDRVIGAVVESGRFKLAATLLTPLFAPSNQTGDDWLDRRIALLARAVAKSAPQDDEAWAKIISSVSWCSRIDSQVRAIASIAMCWNSSRPNEALPDSVRDALSSAIEAIATGKHQRPQ